MVYGSGSADSVEKFGPCGTIALPVFGSAEEVDGAAEEQDHAGEVGFGFGDGYDLVGVCTALDEEGVTNEAALIHAAVEVDALQLDAAKVCGVSENDLVQIVIVAALIVSISCPVVDREEGVGIVPVDAVEADEHAIAAGA